jgi:undecaprenyl diphosphate synthase
MEELEKLTEGKPRIVNLAINYGGRDELVNAFNVLIAEGKRKISEQDISNAIYTKASPPLDMIVRTGGDIRISNFLLWEAAYAELYFTDTLWPDFSKKDIDKAINEFNNRNRRFGGV